jgi:hypothetical protein
MSDSNDKVRKFSASQTAPAGGAKGTPMDGILPSLAADRIYQFAALTAGIFLLVTML